MLQKVSLNLKSTVNKSIDIIDLSSFHVISHRNCETGECLHWIILLEHCDPESPECFYMLIPSSVTFKKEKKKRKLCMLHFASKSSSPTSTVCYLITGQQFIQSAAPTVCMTLMP